MAITNCTSQLCPAVMVGRERAWGGKHSAGQREETERAAGQHIAPNGDEAGTDGQPLSCKGRRRAQRLQLQAEKRSRARSVQRHGGNSCNKIHVQPCQNKPRHKHTLQTAPETLRLQHCQPPCDHTGTKPSSRSAARGWESTDAARTSAPPASTALLCGPLPTQQLRGTVEQRETQNKEHTAGFLYSTLSARYLPKHPWHFLQ